MTILEAEREFIETYNRLDDWLTQYSFLLELAGETPTPKESDKNETTRIHGCQSNAWLILRAEDNCLHITVDSDALLVRGILSVFVLLLDHRTLQEVSETELHFLEETSLKEQVSTDRFAAMYRVSDQIRGFCLDTISNTQTV